MKKTIFESVLVFEKLKSELKTVAFLLSGNEAQRDVHSRLVDCIFMVDRLRESYADAPRDVDEQEEVRKVTRRLKLWSRPERQSQYNARILNAYLELRRSGISVMTEEKIKEKTGSGEWFGTNFDQMKAAAEKNHGKVFDVQDGVVYLWSPVTAAVKAYEQRVFSIHKTCMRNREKEMAHNPDI